MDGLLVNYQVEDVEEFYHEGLYEYDEVARMRGGE